MYGCVMVVQASQLFSTMFLINSFKNRKPVVPPPNLGAPKEKIKTQ